MSEDLSPQKSESVKTTLFTPSLFGGRFTRKQFWGYLILGNSLSAFIAGLVFLACDNNDSLYRIIGIVWGTIFVVFYSLPIAVKRAHDMGCTKKVPVALAIAGCLLNLLSGHEPEVSQFFQLVIGVPYTIWLGFWDSQKGTNKYGPSTKYPDTVA